MHTTTLFTRVKQHSLLFLLFFPTLLSLTPLAYYTLGYPLPKLLHIPTYHLTSIHLLILCIITALLLAEHLPKIPRIAILVLYSAYVFLRWAVCGAWTWFQGMPAHIALEDRGRTVEHRVKHLEKVVVGLQIERKSCNLMPSPLIFHD
ncbi:hypothetical protein P153DRAFT_371430 [Dothidotthia symphoricarpi CBS 119687]|uniref:Uncharacterized protein n=1 Tax=Dothidotthia symphoricarpi CBS 119687 TaxID=1392245 RepID=A0A6A5ZVY4_9PLEO|nr:uncharacterized protein P153DRAFT_371430 [Dothidotthia symphoricarpi CBS 119687]KAF2123750.1 hypothetical protein P153DRAFT_371430 [Dothidotthia symphoricarpi CBS 119687]